MIDYYNYETSPRKIEPEYEAKVQKKKIDRKVEKNTTKKVERKSYKPNKNKATKTNQNLARILYITAGFIVLLTISYRYAIINSCFKEKEELKEKLAEIQKLNQQLKVSIEQGMNINTIEQEAKERLGMQKLDNNQKVYINLDKSDYVESSIASDDESNVDSWWSKLLKDLFKIK